MQKSHGIKLIAIGMSLFPIIIRWVDLWTFLPFYQFLLTADISVSFCRNPIHKNSMEIIECLNFSHSCIDSSENNYPPLLRTIWKCQLLLLFSIKLHHDQALSKCVLVANQHNIVIEFDSSVDHISIWNLLLVGG